ncbi:MAG: beta-glucosidase [Oscillochloris sp.]|nr:beta-glucosidase [Oscillochloris sp.]
MTGYDFPQGFVWGTATAAYQIEGAVHADGRGESIWDRFSHTPGKTLNGDNGDVACDHYHRWPEDIALMADLGIQAYRFSVAWPRILPSGRGKINQAGIDFYSRLVDRLLEHGITPFLTLYHWDLPQVLQDSGGWPARDTAQAFAEYAGIVGRALGDRVKHWMTINEPWCVSILSHYMGEHAPGLQNPPLALAAAHHTLLGHGWAVQELRREAPACEVGIVLNYTASVPASDSAADQAAARRYDGFFNRWFSDPVAGLGYPADMVANYSAAGFLPDGMNFVQPGDMATIATPTDFLGANYYTREVIAAGETDWDWQLVTLDTERTAIGWEIYPQGFYELLLRLYSHYRFPKIYVTENGASYAEGPDSAGRVRDERRVRYLRQHFGAAQRAISAGVPLGGYFVWSLLDNFEWAKGYNDRFGLVHVNYETQQRTPKDSFAFFKQVIAENAVEE